MDIDKIYYDNINNIIVSTDNTASNGKIVHFLSCLGTVGESDITLLEKIIDKDKIGYHVLNENVNIFVFLIYDGGISSAFSDSNVKYFRNGFGIQREYLNNIYIGFFKNNQKDGFGAANFHGSTSIGFWKNNQKHGFHIFRRSRIVYLIFKKYPKKESETFQIGIFAKNRLVNGHAFNPIFLKNAILLGFYSKKIFLIDTIVERKKAKYYLYEQGGKCFSGDNYDILKKVKCKEYILSKNFIHENEFYRQYFYFSNEKNTRCIIFLKKNPVKMVFRLNNQNYEKMVIFYSNGELIQNPCDLIQDKFRELIPKDFICPIAMDIMIQPVMTEKNFTYEYIHIKKWFKKKNTEPLTNEHNKSCSLKFNSQLQLKIFEFICDFFSSKEYRQGEQSEIRSSK